MEMEGMDLGVSQYHRQKVIDSVLISDYISVVLGETVTDTKIQCPNPEHNDKTPSFFFDDAKGVCNCFGCDLGGSVVELHKKVFSLNESQAITELAYKFDIKLEFGVKKEKKESRLDNFKRMLEGRKGKDTVSKLDDLNRNIEKYVKEMDEEGKQRYYKILDIINFTGYDSKKEKLINMMYKKLKSKEG